MPDEEEYAAERDLPIILLYREVRQVEPVIS